MIINIRGLSGSGKSTAVKKIMEHYENCEAVYTDFKTAPTLYLLSSTSMPNPLAVIGPYEHSHSVGGCDVFKNYQQIINLCTEFADRGYDVLYESMLLSKDNGIPRILVEKGHDVAAMMIDVPVDVVAARRQQRSMAVGKSGVLKTATGIYRKETLDRIFLKCPAKQYKTTDAVSLALELLRNQSSRPINTTMSKSSLNDLLKVTGKRQQRIKLPEHLFEV